MDIWGEQVFGDLSQDELMLLILVQLWDLIWKGFALWKAARKKDIFWFVLLILINSAGLLPVFYLFYISEKPGKGKTTKLKIPLIPKAGGDKKKEAEDGKSKKTKPKKKKK
ncbi:MAG: DUF5652 family protein [bacterium]|nr:DUF5652 family protein [bacterium]